jgi:hypothetical protein
VTDGTIPKPLINMKCQLTARKSHRRHAVNTQTASPEGSTQTCQAQILHNPTQAAETSRKILSRNFADHFALFRTMVMSGGISSSCRPPAALRESAITHHSSRSRSHAQPHKESPQHHRLCNSRALPELPPLCRRQRRHPYRARPSPSRKNARPHPAHQLSGLRPHGRMPSLQPQGRIPAGGNSRGTCASTSALPAATRRRSRESPRSPGAATRRDSRKTCRACRPPRRIREQASRSQSHPPRRIRKQASRGQNHPPRRMNPPIRQFPFFRF